MSIVVGLTEEERTAPLIAVLSIVLVLALGTEGKLCAQAPPLLIESLGIASSESGQEILIASSGEPEMVGTQLDRDGVLVLELPRHRPKSGLAGFTTEGGLVSAIEVGVEEGPNGPATRLLIRTRTAVRHAVSLEAGLVRVAVWPAELSRHAEDQAGDQKLAQQLEILETRRQALEAGLAETRAELGLMRQLRAEREADLSRTASALETDLSAAQDKNAALASQAENLLTERQNFAAEAASLAETVESLQTKLAQAEGSNQSLAAELAAARETNISAETRSTAEQEKNTALSSQVESLFTERQNSAAEAASLAETVASLQTKLAQAEGSNQSLAAELAAARETNISAEARSTAEQEKNTALSSQVESLFTERQNFAAEAASLAETVESLETKLAQAEDSDQSLTAELAAAREANLSAEERLTAEQETTAALSLQMEKLFTERQTFAAEAATLAQTVESLETKLAQAEDSHQSLTAELAAARDANVSAEERFTSEQETTAALSLQMEKLFAERQTLAAEAATLAQTVESLESEMAEAQAEVDRYREDGAIRALTVASVNLRSGPGTEHDRLGSLPTETVTEVLVRGDQWARVRVGKREGWVSSAYLRLENDEIMELRQRVEHLGAELEESREGEASATALLEAQSSTADALIAAKAKLEEELASAVDRNAASEAALELSSAELERLSAKSAELEASLTDLQESQDATSAERDDLAAKLQEMAKSSSELEKELASSGSARDDLAAELGAVRTEVDRYREEGLLRATTVAGVNLRSGPGTGYDRLAGLPAETVAEVLTRGDDWTRVRVGGTEGWVSKSYLKLEGDQVNELRLQVESLAAELAQARDSGSSAAERVEKLSSELEALGGEAESLRERNASLGTALEESRQLERSSAEGLEVSSTKQAELEARMGEQQAYLDAVSTERDELSAQLKALAGAHARREEQLVSSAARAESLASELATAKAEIDRLGADSRAREEEYTQELQTLMDAHVSQEEQLASSAALAESLASELATAKAEIDRLGADSRAREEEYTQELQTLADAYVSQEEQLASSAALAESLASELATAKAEIDRLSTEGSAREEELSKELQAATRREAAVQDRAASLESELAATRAAEATLIARAAELPQPTENLTEPDSSALLLTVEAWAAAWTNQDVETYLAFYAPGFEPPGGMNRAAWEAVRRDRVSRPSSISVRLSELEVAFSGATRATATFVQVYESDTFSDTVRKALELVLEEGNWKILREGAAE